jgi:hypothetical protein
MSEKLDHGGPAFPVDRATAHGIAVHTVGSTDEAAYIAEIARLSHGMTLRDYFAAKAMQGYIVGTEQPKVDHLAKVAYQMADAMLKARQP